MCVCVRVARVLGIYTFIRTGVRNIFIHPRVARVLGIYTFIRVAALYWCMYMYKNTQLRMYVRVARVLGIYTFIRSGICMVYYEKISADNMSSIFRIHLFVVHPIVERMAKKLEIISKNFQFSTRQTKILVGFIICTMLLPSTNRKSHWQNSGSLKKFEK